LQKHAPALVIDCHSVASMPLPHEADQVVPRPDVCIGVDSFRAPDGLRTAFVEAFEAAGFTARIDSPFAGTPVPTSFYRSDAQVCGLSAAGAGRAAERPLLPLRVRRGQLRDRWPIDARPTCT
jgi:N-formylglutamate amidohydrolase